MPDLDSVDRLIPRLALPAWKDDGRRMRGMPPDDPVDVDAVKFVLDSVIDFLEELKLSGESLRHAGQLLRDVEALRGSL